jgi:hypothetical protein
MTTNNPQNEKTTSQQENDLLYNERVRWEAIKAKQVRLTPNFQ